MAVSYSWGRGTRSECIFPHAPLETHARQPCPHFRPERHGSSFLPTHIPRTMAEMGSVDYHRSLCCWICWLVCGAQLEMSALPPTVASITSTTDILYCVTEDPYRDKLR